MLVHVPTNGSTLEQLPPTHSSVVHGKKSLQSAFVEQAGVGVGVGMIDDELEGQLPNPYPSAHELDA